MRATPLRVTGELLAWDSVNRRFVLHVPKADPISGQIAKGVDVLSPQTVRGKQYVVELMKHTSVSYVSDKEDIWWELTAIKEAT